MGLGSQGPAPQLPAGAQVHHSGAKHQSTNKKASLAQDWPGSALPPAGEKCTRRSCSAFIPTHSCTH